MRQKKTMVNFAGIFLFSLISVTFLAVVFSLGGGSKGSYANAHLYSSTDIPPGVATPAAAAATGTIDMNGAVTHIQEQQPQTVTVSSGGNTATLVY